MSSLARKAVRGAVWTIASSVAARLIGVVGTLLLTHLLAPDIVGEVSVAAVLVASTNQFSSFGFGQYVVAHPDLEPGGVFQIATLHLGFGLVGIVAVVLLAHPLAPLFDAPHMARYVPGLALSVLLNRMSIIPERVLIREMKFGMASSSRTAGEITYAVITLYTAWLGWGGFAIVFGNLARSAVRTGLIWLAAPARGWLVPTRLDRTLVRDVFRFGTPLWLGASASFCSTKWDNLVFAGLFGPTELGLYNLGYNLADIPTSQVGEHVGDVLLPSFTRMEPHQQRRSLVRSSGLLALIVFPLAVGLGTVAHTLVRGLFNEEWQGVAIYITILSALSVARPVGWIIFSYLQARHRTRPIMVLEIGKLAGLLGFIAALSPLGPEWAASGVGIAFGLHALASMWLIQRTEGIKMTRMLAVMAGPLFACGPMVAAILALRWGFHLDHRHPLPELVLEVLAGGAVYVGACFVVARGVTRDFLGLLRSSFSRGGAAPPEPDA